MLYLFLISFLTYNSQYSEQYIAAKYIKNTLTQDIYYFMDFEKDQIPVPKIYISNEFIPFKIYDFVDHKEPLTKILAFKGSQNWNQYLKEYEAQVNRINLPMPIQKIENEYAAEDANYVLFFSRTAEGLLTAEIFFNHYPVLVNSLAYNRLHSLNGGLKYLFYFKDNIIENVIVSDMFYD